MARRKRIGRLKPMRSSRVGKLMDKGFSYREALSLTSERKGVTKKQIASPLTITRRGKVFDPVRKMLAHRDEVLADAERRGISERQAIMEDYRNNGWVDAVGRPDEWKMFRYFLKDSPGEQEGKSKVLDLDEVQRQQGYMVPKQGTPSKPYTREDAAKDKARFQEYIGRTTSDVSKRMYQERIRDLEQRYGV